MENMSNLPDVPGIDGFYYTAKHIKHHKVEIGEFTYGVPTINILRAGGKIKIGKFCSIANDAKLTIYPEHRTDWVSTYPFVLLKEEWETVGHKSTEESVPFRGDITIGNDVWIGSNATILGGAVIGDGAVIGAHAVVAGRVLPYSVVIGNPARVIKLRFPEEKIDKLLELKWWDWPIEKIKASADILCSGDIDSLLSIADAPITEPPGNGH